MKMWRIARHFQGKIVGRHEQLGELPDIGRQIITDNLHGYLEYLKSLALNV